MVRHIHWYNSKGTGVMKLKLIVLRYSFKDFGKYNLGTLVGLGTSGRPYFMTAFF